MDDNRPRFLSWGAGLQSTVIGEMSARGDLPKCVVLHADTGWERQVTYEVRDWYAERWRKMGMQVEVVTAGNIRMDGTKVHRHIPFYTSDGGPLTRGCTRFFKITPIKRRIREILGFDASKPPHPKPGAAILWLGITVDEWTRAKSSRVKFVENRWPLLTLKMDRLDCRQWLLERDLPMPPKSACVCCPYRRPSEWLAMQESTAEWKAACEFDTAIRHNPLRKYGCNADGLYLLRCLEPLEDADLEFEAERERRYYGTQLPMFACESGFCGV